MDDKTEILSRIDFLAEYQRIGIQFESTEPNAAGWVPCHSIDRDDRNASAAINLQNGFYTDLGNGGRKLDFFALMQIQGGFRSFLDVLNHYRKQFGLEEYHERKNAKNKTPETELDILSWLATRYDRERMGLPPIAKNPLEQSLCSWLFACKILEKTSISNATRTIFNRATRYDRERMGLPPIAKIRLSSRFAPGSLLVNSS